MGLVAAGTKSEAMTVPVPDTGEAAHSGTPVKAMSEHRLETYRSMLALATESLKALLLLHGGAVIAMLAYIGQVQQRELAKLAVWPMRLFATGLVVTMLAFLGAYLCQHALFNEEGGTKTRVGSQAWQWAAVGAGLVSLVLFALGGLLAVDALAL